MFPAFLELGVSKDRIVRFEASGGKCASLMVCWLTLWTREVYGEFVREVLPKLKLTQAVCVVGEVLVVLVLLYRTSGV